MIASCPWRCHLLALVLIYAVPVFLIVYRLDLFEREPNQMSGRALWGGVIVHEPAAQANGVALGHEQGRAAGHDRPVGPAIVARASRSAQVMVS